MRTARTLSVTPYGVPAPPKGEAFLCGGKVCLSGSYPFCEKKWLRNARRRFLATNYNNIFSAGQAFSEGLLRSTLRMILRTGRMLLAFMDSSSTPMRRKVSVRAVSAPSSPQMPTQMP